MLRGVRAMRETRTSGGGTSETLQLAALATKNDASTGQDLRVRVRTLDSPQSMALPSISTNIYASRAHRIVQINRLKGS